MPAVGTQIEAAARTAVGNVAIGGKDIKALKVPLPPPDQQRALAQAMNHAIGNAKAKRLEAAARRQSAWANFESALFTPSEPGTA